MYETGLGLARCDIPNAGFLASGIYVGWFMGAKCLTILVSTYLIDLDILCRPCSIIGVFFYSIKKKNKVK